MTRYRFETTINIMSDIAARKDGKLSEDILYIKF